jgi:serine phosphatase RsbU (regulator of sigma subunit)
MPLDEASRGADHARVVPYRRPKPGGGPRILGALAAMLVAIALTAPAAPAQLSELPRVGPLPPPDETVRRLAAPVQQIVQEPLPSPFEEIVQDSPIAPVRETVRDVAGSPGGDLPGELLPPGGQPAPNLPGKPVPEVKLPGGNAPGQGPTATPSAATAPPAGPGAPPEGAGTQPQAGGRDRADGGGGERAGRGTPQRGRGSARDDGDGPAGRADGAGQGAPAERNSRAAREQGQADEDEQGRLARTVERIVEVVPGFVWAALGALALLALALGIRSFIDRRRARALRQERERLLRDMGLLERVLLPQVPERLGDLAASVAYRPAAGPAAGGDFYDVFELPGGRVALFVGDVSGHGREALERSTALRPALRSHLEAGLSPRAALESAGRAAGIDPSGGFTTVVAAVHDPGSGTLTYAAAGHPPPVLVGPGAHDPLTVSSAPPIGVGLRTGLRQTTVPLPRGSAACFITDGILEARKGDDLLGREWVAEVLAGFGPLDSASALVDRVIEAADEAPDDLTACLVRAVSGPDTVGPRVEELRLEPDDVAAAAPERFLEACGVPEEAIGPALAEARRLAVQAGAALLTVTIDRDDAAVRVTAPQREALATT